MTDRFRPALLALILAACGPATHNTLTITTPAPNPGTPIARTGAAATVDSVRQGNAQTAPSAAQADSLRKHYTDADVAFLNGMIAHHAQAVLIAGWAPSHGASASLQVMCARIVVGQTDEIHLMQQWLRDQHLPVPDASHAMSMRMPGMSMPMMPGMLTDAQLDRLDAARGVDFDRLFLNDMIQHHTGAITMVDQLFATPAAGQVETVFRLASDVYADQTTEIDRMQRMLTALPPHRTAQ